MFENTRPRQAANSGKPDAARPASSGVRKETAGGFADANPNEGAPDMTMMTNLAAASTDRAAWEGAVAKFLTTVEAVKAAPGEDFLHALVAASTVAEVDLMLTPAPDGAALLEKMDICEANGTADICGSAARVREAIRADVERLTSATGVATVHHLVDAKPAGALSDINTIKSRLNQVRDAAIDAQEMVGQSTALSNAVSRYIEEIRDELTRLSSPTATRSADHFGYVMTQIETMDTLLGLQRQLFTSIVPLLETCELVPSALSPTSGA